MLYSIKGKVKTIKLNFVVVESGGLGYKIFLSSQSLKKITGCGKSIQLFLRLYWREETVELFGFLTEEEMDFFEILNTVSGIGPKMALNILGLAPIKKLKSAINQSKTDVLIRGFGIGRKTAERIVLELKDKVKGQFNVVFDDEGEVVDALIGLGYTQRQSREAAVKISGRNLKTIAEKIKAALKEIR